MADKELQVLINKRSSVKGQITKFRNYLTEIESQTSFSSIQLAELALKVSRHEGLSVKFDDLQTQIEVLNSPNLNDELDERDKIEQDLVNNIAKAKSLISLYSENQDFNPEDNPRRRCSHACQDIEIRLPSIEINKFDGSYFRWLEFRDTFENLIHKNVRFTSIHKFRYLNSYLEGEAARVISNLEVSEANYTEAWSLLCNRYNNKRLLVNHHFNSLFNVQPIVRESEKSLRFLVDHVAKNLRALASLGLPTDSWDDLLVFLFASKLDQVTLSKWEEYRNTLNDDLPTLGQFNQFLIDRADVIEALNRNKFNNNNNNKNLPTTSRSSPAFSNLNQNKAINCNQNKNNYTKSFVTTNTKKEKTNTYICIICDGNHKIYDCPTFKAKGIPDRLADVAKFKLCQNCLRQGHPASECRVGPCNECKKRHNTLLHNPNLTHSKPVSTEEDETLVNFAKQPQAHVLLSTALIEVCNPVTNKRLVARALLDCGSQSSFITKSLKQKLALSTNPIDVLKVIGIGNVCNNSVVESCTTQIKSLTSQFSVIFSCFVLDTLTSELPKMNIDIKSINLPNDLKLADPSFNQPAPIDVLIGADIFWDILGNEQRSLGPCSPKLRNSKFGWIVSGPISNNKLPQNKVQCNHVSMNTDECSYEEKLDQLLTKFWIIEELPKKALMSESEKACERHFLENTIRLDTGRFSVKLPFKDSPDCLGDTYSLAKKRLNNLEKKFKRSFLLKTEYSKFLQEYSDLGHLSESSVVKPDISYFLCHHAVFKHDSESTKIRVVFDGSASSTSGYSLNDILMVGPNVQDSLFSILIRARQYKYLLTGDIEKMYRQVEVQDADRDLQLIVWREEESMPIKTYRLNTLTYGTASASYLSTRCLSQLGEELDDTLIKNIIQKDFYIDDLITGADNIEQLRYIQISVTNALKEGCFNLRKFKTNSKDLFHHTELNTQGNLIISESTSTLGLGWNPNDDTLHFPLKLFSVDKITKRTIMSNSFKLFDPLGLLSPFIIRPKILLQRLWQEKVQWDDPLPKDICEEWKNYSKEFPSLENLHIPRLVLCDFHSLIEIHSFSDASEAAYGACIYMRSINANNEASVHLLCAKSKVAPIKPTTMPRLELCAALLAARLTKSVTNALRYKPNRIAYWCDSSIVLAWIHGDVTKLKAFVANRILEIQETTYTQSWRYVPTAQNPADLISRGSNAHYLMSLKCWWNGPDFLSKQESEWPVFKPQNKNNIILPEIKVHTTTIIESIINFENFSNLNRLQRAFAYVQRFIFNLRNPKGKREGKFIIEELNNSFNTLCILSQKQSFPAEYDLLSKGKTLSPKSKLLSLSPFMDDQQLIRVGGRLEASQYSYEKKHPILLHSSHHLTKLLFIREHLINLHAGPQLLLATVREKVWPVNGRHLARRIVSKCVRCRRARGKTLCPKMGDLPSQRVNPDFPFLSVGLDFAGPFQIINRKGRGSRVIKCYLCLFVCLRYKCVHLEGVSDLSKDAFLMTLRRFVARRGKPVEIFCDNGRNFVAAAKDLGNFLKSNVEPLSDFASQEGIKFMFTPTYAPHFGGIWEAGIKSAKHHLKRVIGNSHLTFEEISTLFAQVEAILNSRPLCPMSSSPNDLLSLSPGHFLIGRPLNALPAPALETVSEKRLQRYARLEQIRQQFWKRWQKEYVCELQGRCKWKTNAGAKLNVGDLVILHEDYVPPLSWRLGRVERLFPGPDGVARVADVRTTRGCVRRPLVRLCPLPSDEDFRS